MYADKDQFSCGYCGTSIQAVRRGGTVVLNEVEAAIRRVQVRTDKTAAELALPRCPETELVAAKQAREKTQGTVLGWRIRLKVIKSPRREPIALLSIVCMWVLYGEQRVDGQTSVRQPLTTAEIVRHVTPAIVDISGAKGAATGFIVDPSGTIVTNLHVIAGMQTLTVQLANGDTFERVVVRAYDESKDIAILQVPGFSLPTVQLGNSDSVQQGDPVVLIGNPLGLRSTVSAGLVSAIRQTEGYRVIQTDAAASPGSSGGPLLNESGKVIGILRSGVRGDDLNFVIPINYARGLLQIRDDLTLTELNRQLRPQQAASPAQATPAPGGPAPVTKSESASPPAFSFALLDDKTRSRRDASGVIALLTQLATWGWSGQSGTWPVDHAHASDFSTKCRGSLRVVLGRLKFSSPDARENFDVPVEAVEVGAGSVFGTLIVNPR